ncbi:MAG: hypothetical protein ACTHY6_12665 [Corynebacterium variabile]
MPQFTGTVQWLVRSTTMDAMGKLGALGVWTRVRRARLEDLAADIISGEGPTNQAGLLYVALAAEFQGYCRDLHQECVDDLLDQMSVLPYRLRATVALTLESGRALDRNNATAAAIAKDFKTLDISPWESIQRRHKDEYREWRETLDRVNIIRNAAAHSDEEGLDGFVEDGVLTPEHWLGCLRQLSDLVLALHNVTAAHLTEIAFDIAGERSGADDE